MSKWAVANKLPIHPQVFFEIVAIYQLAVKKLLSPSTGFFGSGAKVTGVTRSYVQYLTSQLNQAQSLILKTAVTRHLRGRATRMARRFGG